MEVNFKYHSILSIIWTVLLAFSSVAKADSSTELRCLNGEASREIVSASVTGLELLEIIQRIDQGEIASARSLAESYLDTQIVIIEQLAGKNVTEAQKNKGADVVARVRMYRTKKTQGNSER